MADSGRHARVGHGTHRVALRRLEAALAFRALLWIDHKCIALHRNCCIGTFKFANAAAGALGSDDLIGHVHLLLRTRRRACYEGLAFSPTVLGMG